MKIALLGNPNTGKSSVFNSLTGLRQHVGNFPGVTVDKKIGEFTFENSKYTLTDFPGTYSIYPRSKDEEVVYNVLSDSKNKDYPDLAIVVVDASNIERNLLLFTQIYDLEIPTILVLNMSDIANRKGLKVDIEELKKSFPKVEVVETNARIGLGIQKLKEKIHQFEVKEGTFKSFLPDFKLLEMKDLDGQSCEAEKRFSLIQKLLNRALSSSSLSTDSKSNKLDRILVHPIFGYLIFTIILFFLFQFIYVFASYPMDWIDENFGALGNWFGNNLPEGLFSDLISQGIIPGIGGVLVFVPQIALLFFFISILEESGYLSRVVFIMDRLMRPLGLNGKSVVPLLSSVACAIPGVMAARTISNWKERLITILVAPLMSCSARIPVYTLLIALVIPSKTILGFINVQGLVLFGLYFLGLISALVVAAVLHLLMKTKDASFLLLEMPSYKIPRLRNIGLNVLEKVKVFVLEAGKVIIAISILLWVLATFGPTGRMDGAVQKLEQQVSFQKMSEEEQDQKVASTKLGNSYIGILGKSIEPIIAPLGYDWKIGISLITSFAAREVFVGSLATIYSVHDDGEENVSLLNRMRNEKKSDGTLVYTLGTGISLMVFYVYAMQCMATLAVVKRETKGWKWPLIQMGFMGVLAYAAALIAFNIFS
jgi:ferrous iron transport protein B